MALLLVHRDDAPEPITADAHRRHLLALQSRASLAVFRRYIARCSAQTDRYRAQYRRLTEAYRYALVAADPRLDLEMAFHLAHNWGNDAAKSLLERFDAAMGRLHARYEAAYRRYTAECAGACAR